MRIVTGTGPVLVFIHKEPDGLASVGRNGECPISLLFGRQAGRRSLEVGPGVQMPDEVRAVDAVLHRAREPRAHFGLVAVADCLQQQLAQRLPLELELAEHVEHLPA